MTAPSTPTPATLDAAVEAAARSAYDEVRNGIIRDARWKPPAPWDELSDLDKHYWLVTIRPHIETAAPLFAAAHADQLAQARAASTAAGAAAERERIWREQSYALGNARSAMRRLRAVLIATAHLLDVPFTNAPETSPWKQTISPAITRLDEALGQVARAGTNEVPS